jgi:transcriptional regulator with XRE-family HTH domain
MDKLIKSLDEYRLEHKISQEKLAKILGVTFVTVNRWFNGHTLPNKIQRYHIQKLLSPKGHRK